MIFNQGAENIYGYTQEEVFAGMNLSQLYPEGVAEEIAQMIQRPEFGGPGRLANYEVEALGRDGNRIPILLSAALLQQRGEAAATVVYFKDRRDIRRLEQELLQSERMAATGEALAGVAHGVKNILHVMNLAVYLVDMGLEKQKGELVAKGWKLVRKNVDRISKMTSDMLNYARTGPPVRKECSLNAIVNESLELITGKARERGIRLVRELDSALPLISVDPKGVHLCPLNLLTNAIEAIPETGQSGQIIVCTRDEGEDGVRLQVKDTGIGMSKEFQKEVFERLASTKGAKGTGLGLVTAQKIVHEHGGNIQVESEPQKGSCFTISLPGRVDLAEP
jgi:PAS domain S-box-containing protein